MTADNILAITTIIAVLVGPIAAVYVTRLNDDRRAKRFRRMEIFRNLMRTRRVRLDVDHVGALNLVEIEFYKESEVIQAWRTYLLHLETPIPPEPNQETFFQERETRFAKMLHAIAHSLGFNLEQLDLFKGGYTPQGWGTVESQQAEMRTLLIALLKGQQPLRVSAVALPSGPSPFPPPPSGS